MINRNKQGLRLDLKKPEGVEVFRRLAQRRRRDRRELSGRESWTNSGSAMP
jgi:hypothetical protein